ncbi:N-terminal Xaa-Pro-Lys N-methyltransferase 1 isoform X1 [Belonocnema kinseyi]|uniref:N-terminal Xaa-Pro-Lys N-methyltransferase 1 isoform X1 n=1 Tax=Belonocnema kinseyi TaxID=2817044 RepID=UPI00143E003F|nr:N-terminal Xaa-Pro-Lys N-methyltransferase 1 isoform X1 [Belonocnema kinseyi]
MPFTLTSFCFLPTLSAHMGLQPLGVKLFCMQDKKVYISLYKDAAKYWSKIPPTVNGMLGGFGFISKTDLEGSSVFLKSLFKIETPPQNIYGLDCGAGIGRVTKNLLTRFLKRVDLVEQNSKFLEAAKIYLETSSEKIGEFYPIGLQDFCPVSTKYDLIWTQWVLGHLRNEDLIRFLKNCVHGLKENGVIVIKENVTSVDKMDIDTADSSVTRPYGELHKIFKRAGLSCIKEQKQNGMPRGLYPVYMFALRPQISAANLHEI